MIKYLISYLQLMQYILINQFFLRNSEYYGIPLLASTHIWNLFSRMQTCVDRNVCICHHTHKLISEKAEVLITTFFLKYNNILNKNAIPFCERKEFPTTKAGVKSGNRNMLRIFLLLSAIFVDNQNNLPYFICLIFQYTNVFGKTFNRTENFDRKIWKEFLTTKGRREIWQLKYVINISVASSDICRWSK